MNDWPDVSKVSFWYLDRVINNCIPGLQMFVRDVNMSEELAAKYVPGEILRDVCFVDATPRVGGLATTH